MSEGQHGMKPRLEVTLKRGSEFDAVIESRAKSAMEMEEAQLMFNDAMKRLLERNLSKC